jgi:aspartyl-tRNA(Asn)/glutamyl-tRNA(Gln) amidotransferase subunit C
VSVTNDEVRKVADLARLSIPDDRLPALVAELNRILAHMDVLSKVKTGESVPAEGIGAAGTPLRPDGGTPVPLQRPIADFAPAVRDGFILVPRLATHDQLGEEAS